VLIQTCVTILAKTTPAFAMVGKKRMRPRVHIAGVPLAYPGRKKPRDEKRPHASYGMDLFHKSMATLGARFP
jgi:hypothetical protein